MFADPETLWLNVTNVGLGLAVLAFCALILYAILREVSERVTGSGGETAVFLRSPRRVRRLHGSMACNDGACGAELAGGAD